jgi:hypothetical protein
MRDAGNNDRDVLISGIKDSIHSYPGCKVPPLTDDDGVDIPRGYRDSACADYIAPFTCDPSDPTYVHRTILYSVPADCDILSTLEKLLDDDPSIVKAYDQWPRMCWWNQQPTLTDLNKGFLKNILAAQVGVCAARLLCATYLSRADYAPYSLR